MAKKIRVWDGSAWQDVAPALPYTAIHSAQASMPLTGVDGQVWLDTDGTLSDTAFVPLSTIDAKGDLLVGTADNTVSRLASSGTNDQVLTVDSSTATGLKWATPSAGGMTLISEQVASSATGISFSSIPSTYKQLLLVWNGVYHSTSGSDFNLRFNNSSSGVYYAKYLQNTGVETQNAQNQLGQNLFGSSGNGASVQDSMRGFLQIDNYASTSSVKSIQFTTISQVSGTGYVTVGNGLFNSTSAISSIDIVRTLGSAVLNNLTNTSIRLYGVS